MLKVITGPMFAGKTTKLLTEIKSLGHPHFVVYKPSNDTRYAKEFAVTHDGQKVPAITIDPVQPFFHEALLPHMKTVFIDELNFFKFDHLYPRIKNLLSRGLDVIGAGLLYDFRKQPFGATYQLAQQADGVEHLYANCDSCGEPAQHSYRKVANDDQLLVGASESYGACCDNCWEKLQN
ncbi:MAG TPA: hypothetical protein VLH19_01825 [Patescibacteria group bacterium]|nr:hypothetical protein [Patescibacteria group bacterium]